jgi:hypothetical protein
VWRAVFANADAGSLKPIGRGATLHGSHLFCGMAGLKCVGNVQA